jgi:patatin-like phospholipase/acyl hydrolase
MSKPVKILSIDGGGIRGMIPAVVLAGLEQRTGKRVADMFDLIAGTSTGGILALALTKPDGGGRPQYQAEDVVRLYEREGRRIFHRSGWRTVAALAALAEEKFPSSGIEGVLEDYFGEARLKDAATDVIITSYEIERRFPFFFKSRNARIKPGYDFAMKHVARATCAAPTFFEPCKLEADGPEDYYALVDGGLYANNPAMCGLVEAMTCWPQATEFLVVSLGTGEQLERLAYDKVKGWGLAHWAKPVLEIVFDAVSSTVDYQLRQILPSTHYFRFQTHLPCGSESMDNASPENLRGLKLQGEALVRERHGDLAKLAAML